MSNASEKRRFWGYRIDTSRTDYFWKELQQERLRQGWGWLLGQELSNLTIDEGAARNKRMFHEVKQEHILLIPRLPEWDKVAVVKAIEDWDTGYRFEISPEYGDYGHIFPAKYITRFSRGSAVVTADLKSTLKNRGRFWNIDHLCDDVERILAANQWELDSCVDDETKLMDTIGLAFQETFKRELFGNRLISHLNKVFGEKSWETVLVEVLKGLLPNADIKKVSGPQEKKHGTDILVTIPGLTSEQQYSIALQVKDHQGKVGQDDPIEQIKKASYWTEKEGMKLIEKIVILTRAKRMENQELAERGAQEDVRIVFEEDLNKILVKYALQTLGLETEDSD